MQSADIKIIIIKVDQAHLKLQLEEQVPCDLPSFELATQICRHFPG